MRCLVLIHTLDHEGACYIVITVTADGRIFWRQTPYLRHIRAIATGVLVSRQVSKGYE